MSKSREDELWNSLGPDKPQDDKPVKAPRIQNRLKRIAELPKSSDVVPFAKLHPDVVAWLESYKGNFEFYLSVRDQYQSRGELSDKQIAAIKRAIEKDQQKSAPNQRVLEVMKNPTYKPGTVLEVKKSMARRLQEEYKMSHLFYILEVVNTFRETEKAIYVSVRLVPRFANNCMICGLTLENQVSRATGIGPICAKKTGIARYSIGDAQFVLKEIESKLPKGERTMWVPRSTIKGIVPEET